MQVMIDFTAEAPAALVLKLTGLLAIAQQLQSAGISVGTPPAPAHSLPPVPPPPPPSSNVVPLFPTPPAAPAAAGAASSSVPTNYVTGAATSASANAASGATPPATPTGAAAAAGGTPSPSSVPAGTTAAPPLLDSKGMPHDARIHSVPAKVKKDGSWQWRKGVQDQVIAQVEAELRARMAAGGTPQAAPVIPPAPPAAGASMPVPPPPSDVPAPPASAGTVPPPPPPPAGNLPAGGNSPTDFVQFMTKVNTYSAQGRFSMAQLPQIMAEMQLPNTGALVGRADLIAWADGILERIVNTGA